MIPFVLLLLVPTHSRIVPVLVLVSSILVLILILYRPTPTHPKPILILVYMFLLHSWSLFLPWPNFNPDVLLSVSCPILVSNYEYSFPPLSQLSLFLTYSACSCPVFALSQSWLSSSRVPLLFLLSSYLLLPCVLALSPLYLLLPSSLTRSWNLSLILNFEDEIFL